MIELITGADGTAHVSSADDGALYASIVGIGSYSGKGVGEGLAISVRDNNHLTLGTGCGWHNGRGWRVTSQHDVVVQSGTQAQRRADLVVARYSVEGDREKMEILTLKGESVADSAEPEYPSHEKGSVLDGARVSDMPLYGVKLNGLNIEGTEKMFSEVPSLSDLLNLIQTANKSIEDLKKVVDGKAASEHGHAASTQSAPGFMSAADKKKLDGVAAGANDYSLPTGNGNTKGGLKLSDSTTSTSDVNGGIAATPAAVKAVKDSLTKHPVGELIWVLSGKTPAALGKPGTWVNVNACITTEKFNVLDIKDGNDNAGSGTQIYHYNGSTAQRWHFYTPGKGGTNSGEGQYYAWVCIA